MTEINLEFLKNRLSKINNKEEESLDEISLFIKQFNIKKGKDKVETFIIYAMYLKLKSTNPKLSRVDFFRKLCKNIETVRWGKQRYYLVDRSVMLLSTDDEENMRIHESIRKKEINLRKKKGS